MRIHRLVTRLLAVAVLGAGLAVAAGARADDAADARELVDRARITVENILGDPSFDKARAAMSGAKGVLIVPRLFKAGFILGGAGGSGVLLARTADGGWSYPAFYTLGEGSIGLQIGVKDSEVLFILRNAKALNAVLADQVKLGADISVAAGTVGAGMGASTTTNLGADMVAFAKSRGAFGGGAFEGSVIAKRTDYNAAFYGREVSPQAIVLGGEVSNPDADPLRAALARY